MRITVALMFSTIVLASYAHAAEFARLHDLASSATQPSINGSGECLHEGWRPGGLLENPNPRVGAASVWTGSQVILWGGDDEGAAPWIYDPATDTWTLGSPLNAPNPTIDGQAVWLGSEAAFFGGKNRVSSTPGPWRSYNPSTDAWSDFSLGFGYSGSVMAWTGFEIIVFGGSLDFCISEGDDLWQPRPQRILGVFDVGANDSDYPNLPPEVESRSYAASIWSGTEFLMQGGVSAAGNLSNGRAYDPASDTWRELPSANSPGHRMSPASVWTGTEWIVFSGRTGSAYDPIANSWRVIAALPAQFPTYLESPASVWTGTEMIVWGSSTSDEAAIYDPAIDSWRLSTDAGVPTTSFGGPHAFWTGSEALFLDPESDGVLGARYDPVLDSWLPVASTDYSERQGEVVVFSGTELLVYDGDLQKGFRYDLATETWSPMNPVGQPSPGPTVWKGVWIGSAMLVIGERGSPVLQEASLYDPSTDTWTPASTADMPFFLEQNAYLEWVDPYVVYWGQGSQVYFGGRYDPTSDQWLNMARFDSGGPAPTNSSIVDVRQTGNRAYVWLTFKDHWFYDPVADSWFNASEPADFISRIRPAWDGSRLLYWNRSNDDRVFIYHTVSDSWEEKQIEVGPYKDEQIGGQLIWDGSGILNQYTMRSSATPCGNGVAETSTVHDRWDDTQSAYEVLRERSPIPVRDDSEYFWTGSELLAWSPSGGVGAFYSPVRIQNPDADSDGFGVCLDCLDDNPNAYPGALDCNNDDVDNDCDFRVDEDPRFTAYADNDMDGFGDPNSPASYCENFPPGHVSNDQDCNDFLGDVWQQPADIADLTLVGDALFWADDRANWGATSSSVFQLAQGLATRLQDPSRFLAAQCIGPALAISSFVDPASPPVNEGFYYLVRGNNACGAGTWGASEGDERDTKLQACP